VVRPRCRVLFSDMGCRKTETGCVLAETGSKVAQMEGIAMAKAGGVYAGKGRPASVNAVRVREMRAQGLGPTAIAKTLGIGRASVYRVLEAG
jgi:hypothetical protein